MIPKRNGLNRYYSHSSDHGYSWYLAREYVRGVAIPLILDLVSLQSFSLFSERRNNQAAIDGYVIGEDFLVLLFFSMYHVIPV